METVPRRRVPQVRALIVLCAVCSLASANTYYVSFDGDDTRAGTNPAASWAACPGMPAWSGTASLAPGDTVLFNSAHVWETASGNAVLEVTGGVCYDGASWGDGTRALFRAGADLRRSVVAILRDHETVPTVVRGFEIDAANTVTTGIGINHPQMERPLTGATKRIEDCVVHDVRSSASEGTYKYGIVVSNWSGQYQVSNVEILSCRVYTISRGGINLYPGNDVPENRVRSVLVRGNEVWNAGTDPSYGGSSIAVKNHVIDAVIEYNSIHDPARGIGIGVSTHESGFTGPENLIIRHNIIRGSKHTGIYIQDFGDKSVEIVGNIIAESANEAIRLTGDLTGRVRFGIYNNTLVNNFAGSQWSQQIRILCKDATVEALEIKNNLIYSSHRTRCILDDHGMVTAHEGNLYYREDGGTLVIADGDSYDASNVTVWEPSAVVQAPGLGDIDALPSGFTGTFGHDLRPDRDGLAIASGSPARDAGVSLGSPYATSINSVIRPAGPGWDIGAYERGTGSSAGLRSPAAAAPPRGRDRSELAVVTSGYRPFAPVIRRGMRVYALTGARVGGVPGGRGEGCRPTRQ
jgi:predicted heme/steroid binding protein